MSSKIIVFAVSWWQIRPGTTLVKHPLMLKGLGLFQLNATAIEEFFNGFILQTTADPAFRRTHSTH